MLIAALALLLAPANSAVAVTTTASASATAPTEAVDMSEAAADAEPTEERICRKRPVGGGGVSLVGANKMRTVCKTRAQWSMNGAPAR